MPAPSSNRIRWVLSASLTLVAVLWILGGCGGPQEGQNKQAQEAMYPTVGEFVGETPTLDAFVALVAQEPQDEEEGKREVRVYVSDGDQLPLWFTATVSGDSFQMSANNGVKLYANLAPELTRGRIVLSSGESFDFEIPPAWGIDGVYPVIVPPDGGEVSSTSWRGAHLEGTRGGQEITGTITPPDRDEEAVGFRFSVPISGEGEDRWIVFTTNDRQPKIKGATIAGLSLMTPLS